MQPKSHHDACEAHLHVVALHAQYQAGSTADPLAAMLHEWQQGQPACTPT